MVKDERGEVKKGEKREERKRVGEKEEREGE